MKQIDRLEGKIDHIVDKMGDMSTTLGKQAIILDEHVRRTNLLEKKIEPIESHVNLIKSIVKIIGFVGMGVILKILHALVIK